MADDAPPNDPRRTKSTLSERTKAETAGFIRNDLLGADDWKRSKIGAITGIPVAFRAMSSMGRSISDSSRHLGLLVNGLTAKDTLPELGEEYDESDERARFYASMQLHGRSEKDLAISLRNTFYSAYLYFTLSLANVMISTMSIIADTPQDIVSLVMRCGPLPLLLALFLKHSYTNWLVRNRILSTFTKFILSGRFLPQK